MGLDMYLMAREKPVQLSYWRKHNALHHWFEKKAIELKIVEEPMEFNCVNLELTEEILDELEQDLRNLNLTPVEGFFFGTTEYDPAEYLKEDLAAVNKAREALKDGKTVYYTSWW